MRQVHYVLADFRTGEIEQSGMCDAESFDATCEAGHQVKVIGCGMPETHYYTPLGLCEYTTEQKAAKALPRPHSRWDNGLMKWVDVRPLTELRAERWAQLKAERAAAIDAPIDTPWGRFDANAPSRAAIAEAAAVQEPDAAISWTTADNTVATLARATLADLLRLIDQRTQQAHAQARMLRSQIEAASSVGDLEAITWPQAP